MTPSRPAGDGGAPASPGRRTRRFRWAAGTAAALALLVAGAATVGAARGGGGSGASGAPAASSADAGFARDMAVHHQQAVEMSFVVRDRTDDEDVRRLAYDIANTQANQRGMLLGWLDLWGLPKVAPGGERPMAWMAAEGEPHGQGHGAGGHGPGHGAGPAPGGGGAPMPGMADRAELERLGRLDGRAAEVLFLRLMTDHHKGGVVMAEACVARCAVPVERRLAQGMVDGQRSELDLMRDMLAERGSAPRS